MTEKSKLEICLQGMAALIEEMNADLEDQLDEERATVYRLEGHLEDVRHNVRLDLDLLGKIRAFVALAELGGLSDKDAMARIRGMLHSR